MYSNPIAPDREKICGRKNTPAAFLETRSHSSHHSHSSHPMGKPAPRTANQFLHSSFLLLHSPFKTACFQEGGALMFRVTQRRPETYRGRRASQLNYAA
jgi:hypothetical protein